MKKFLFLAILATTMTTTATTFTETSLSKKDEITKAIEKNADKLLAESSKGLNTTYSDVKSSTTTVYGDSKEAVTTVYNDVKSIVPDIKTALVALAEGLKTTSEKVWDILVMQQYVWSTCYLLIFLSSLFLWYKFGKLFNKMQTDKDDNDLYKDSNVAMVIIIGILALSDSIVSALHMSDMLTGFINPEFGALKTIFQMVKNI